MAAVAPKSLGATFLLLGFGAVLQGLNPKIAMHIKPMQVTGMAGVLQLVGNLLSAHLQVPTTCYHLHCAGFTETCSCKQMIAAHAI